MRNLFTKWLSALLIAALLLTPVALMEGEAVWESVAAEEKPGEESGEEVCLEAVVGMVDEYVDEETDDYTGDSEYDEYEADLPEDSLSGIALETASFFEAEDDEEDEEDYGEPPVGWTNIVIEEQDEDGKYTNFPDDIFRQYILDKINTDKTEENGKQVLTWNEVMAVRGMHLFKVDVDGLFMQDDNDDLIGLGIESLKGIEYFTNLEVLYCSNNKLTGSLDVSGLSKLERIGCRNNSLESLNVSGLSCLQWLDCWSNSLETLNVSGSSNLLWLYCGNNKLKSLNASGLSSLLELVCINNKLETLNVSGLSMLQLLMCDNNKLESLNIEGCDILDYLDCQGNHLTSLDVTHCSALTHIDCSDNDLQALDISGCTELLPYVAEQYKKVNDDAGICAYLDDEYDDDPWIYLRLNSQVKLITEKTVLAPKPTPEVASNPAPALAAPAAPAMAAISAVKKSGKATVNVGTVYQLDLGGTTGKSFKSSKKKVATVSSTGLVTPKKAGKTKITFKVGKKKRTVTLTVKDPTIPTRVTLSVPTTAVRKGDVVALTANLPEGTNSGIKWTSSNKKVATVSNGVVTFKKAGKVTITATATRGKKKARVKFKVSK